MASKTVGIVLVTAVTAGCATTGDNPWNPARLAPEPQVYAGAAIGGSSFDANQQETDAGIQDIFNSFGFPVQSATSSLDDSDTGYAAVLGYRFATFFGTEIAYFNLGETTYNTNLNVSVPGVGIVPASVDLNVSVDGLGVSGLAFLPLTESWELYVRGGLLFSNTEVESNFNFGGQNQPDSFSGNSNDLFAGLGASFRYADQYTFRLEYQRFNDVGNNDTDESTVDFIGLQVMYSFF